MHYSEVWYYKN